MGEVFTLGQEHVRRHSDLALTQAQRFSRVLMPLNNHSENQSR